MANTKAICVHIVAGHGLVTQRLKEILEVNAAFEIKVLDGSRMAWCPKAVFVIDAASVKTCLEVLLRTMRIQEPSAKAIVIGEKKPEDFAGLISIVQMGVRGWIPQEEVANCLVPTIRAVASEMYCFRVFEHPMGAAPIPGLTRRQREIHGLLQRRFSNREISEALGIGESTVKSYVARDYGEIQGPRSPRPGF